MSDIPALIKRLNAGANLWEETGEMIGVQLVLRQATAELARLQQERDALREALHSIVQWSEAYPLTVFPEPDLKLAKMLLEDGGVTLDALSAGAMRHVVEGVGKIARAALEAKP